MKLRQAHIVEKPSFYFIVSSAHPGAFWGVNDDWTAEYEEAVSFVAAEKAAAYAKSRLFGKSPYRVVLR